MHIEHHSVSGGGGCRLNVETFGNPAHPAVIYLHGYAQSRLAWLRQFADPMLYQSIYQVRLDMRGHGASDKPEDPAAYQDGRMWADDVQAVIEALGLRRPVLAGSSYGGLVITNYLEHHGQERIGGVAYVGAGSETGSREAGELLGAEFMQLGAPMLSPDLAVAVPAIRRYIEISTEAPMRPEDMFMFIGFNVIVPAHVRQGMLLRQFSSDEVLRGLKLPAMIIHGAQDRVVLPGFADFIAARVPQAERLIYPGCGHFPFYERPAQFNADIAAFVQRCASA